MDWQSIAESQAMVIEGLSVLCKEVINELSQYKNIETEENRYSELMSKDQ